MDFSCNFAAVNRLEVLNYMKRSLRKVPKIYLLFVHRECYKDNKQNKKCKCRRNYLLYLKSEYREEIRKKYETMKDAEREKTR